MDFEPQKFFVGLVDFFSVLMPGAVLTYLGKDWAASGLLLDQNGLPLKSFPLDGVEHLVMFLFASYLVGHFVFLLGAFLDEWIYEPLRGATPLGQMNRLAQGKSLMPRWVRWLAQSNFLFGRNADEAVTKAVRLKALALRPISAERAVNAYQWCKAWLLKEHREGLVAVQRFEADSKFFRSFVVVLLALAAVFLFRWNWILFLVCLGLLLPALLRYIDQRFKGTQQAYWFVITLKAFDHASNPGPPKAKSDGPSHAGGVVFRRRGGAVEYLLVQSDKDRKQYVVPKGHIEPGDDMRETAVRKVFEKTGNWARVIQRLDEVWLADGADCPRTCVYLMESVGEVEPRRGKKGETLGTEERRYHWLMLSEAQERASSTQTKELLDDAEKRRAQMED